MRKPALWNKRRRYFEARRAIPPELREIIGKPEFRESVGADKREAERRALALQNRWQAELDEAREQLESMKPTIGSAAKAHYRSELQHDDVERRGGEQTLIELRQFSQPIRASRLRLVAAGQITGEEAEALIGYAADQLKAKGIAPDVPRAALLKALAEVQLDAMVQFEARDKGTLIAPEPKSPLLTEPDPEPAKLAPKDRGKGATLSDVLEAFHRERTAGARTLADKTMAEHKVAVRMFDEFMTRPMPVKSITRADLLGYKQALLQTPNRYSLRFPGLTLPQAIKANAKRETPYPTLDPATINMKWLSHLSTIFKWASNNGYIDTNPATGVRIDEGNGYKEPNRTFYSQDDLKAIFGNEFFKHPSEYGSRQWALLLALYTGARSSSEIARVRLADIYEEQGFPVIDLALASKNVRSKRLVPIHASLIKLGFLTYVDKLRKKGQEQLFPDWEPEDKINRWFLRTYKPLVGINDKRKVLHSFRNTLKTALARHGVNRDVSDLITGHKDQSVGGIYIGDASVTMVKAMHDSLNRVAFDLPIPALKADR